MRYSIGFIFVALSCIRVSAATLEVGDGKAFPRPEAAIAHALPGDEIVVYAKNDGQAYSKVALQIKTDHLTIRAADDKNPVKFDGTGFEYSGSGSTPRAIVQFNPGADGCVLERFELAGARNQSFNGAGVRINQANDVVIRNCAIHDNDMGIMSNGSLADKTGANQLIDACIISSNGSLKDPGYNHNLYLGGTSVTVRGCEISHSVTGHNLKSRAHFNWIEYNYIHDSANREIDLVDEKGNTDSPGSDAVLLGNFISKSPNMSGNKTVIHFGQDSGKNDHTGTLFLVHNTIATPYISPVVDLSAPGATAVFWNNAITSGGAKSPGVLVAVRDGATLDDVRGDGNEIAEAFQAKMPAGVKNGPVIAWEKIELPWPGGKQVALQEFLGAGKVEKRKSELAGAGDGVR